MKALVPNGVLVCLALKTLALVMLAAQAVSGAVFQLGPSADTRIGNLFGNEGGTIYLSVFHDGGPNVQRSLLRFDLSSLGQNGIITNAVLRLYADPALWSGGNPGQPMEVYRLTQPWNEAEVNWTNRAANASWASPGGDYVGTTGIRDMAPYAVNNTSITSLSQPVELTWDITSLAQEWYSGARPNNGLMLLSYAGNQLHFRSRENATNAPVLEVRTLTAHWVNAGDMIVGNDGDGTVVKVDHVTGEQTLLASNLFGVHGLALAAGGDLYILQHAPVLTRLEIATGLIANITSAGLLGDDSVFRAGLALASNGDIYVSCYTYPSNQIVKINPKTGVQTLVASGWPSGLFAGPIGLAFAPSGELMIADIAGSAIVGLNLRSGAQRWVARNLGAGVPWGLAVRSDGTIFAGRTGDDGTRNVLGISSGGAVSVVASNGFLKSPFGVALESDSTIVICQPADDSIVRLSTSSTNQTLITAGGMIHSPLSLIVSGTRVPAPSPCDPSSLTLTNPAGTIQFEQDALAVDESGTNAVVTVRRLGGANGAVNVNYQTVDGTAIGGMDFVPISGTLAFADGETVKSIFIPILDDSLVEQDEQFLVRLTSAGGGASLGVCTNLAVTILDDDGCFTLPSGAIAWWRVHLLEPARRVLGRNKSWYPFWRDHQAVIARLSN